MRGEWQHKSSIGAAGMIRARHLQHFSGLGSAARHGVLAGQNVGVTQVGERIWLVTFMRYDLGYFDDEVCRLEPIANPFGPKLLPVRSE